MGGLLGTILGAPFKGLLDGIGGILGKVVTTDKDRLDLQTKLLDAQRQFEISLAEADQKFADSQASVITAEIKSESWLAANWRPILMLTFTFIIAWNYIIIPIFGAFTSRLHPAEIVPQMWELLKLGVTGYIVGRSGEKMFDSWVAAKK